MIIEKNHKILYFNVIGIKANIKTVRVVKTVIECPEGKLAKPMAVFPRIKKLSLSKTSEGRGTRNKFFNIVENKAENNEADNNASQIFEAYRMKIVKNDKKIEASPI